VTAVLTGHVHRHQVLTSDLDGTPLAAPVIYAGSTERTAFAEKDERKGTVLLEAGVNHPPRAGGVRWLFRELPARPMVVAHVRAEGADPAELLLRISTAVRRAPPDAVLRLRIAGRVPETAREALAASTLRALAPPSMNVEVLLADEPRGRWRPSHERPVGHHLAATRDQERPAPGRVPNCCT
jgi:DNA repair exonuclease SbcCD nuclease subunit